MKCAVVLSFVVALVLFTLGGVFAIVEGVNKLRNPEHAESIGWAIGTLLVAMVLEGLSLRTAVREARPTKGDDSWWQFIRHAKTPEIPVVILEDFGALIGFLAAIFAGWLGGVLAPAHAAVPVASPYATPAAARPAPLGRDRVVRQEVVRERRPLIPSLGRKGGERVVERRDEEIERS